jgi:uroporphyrinogen-III decarboxylase
MEYFSSKNYKKSKERIKNAFEFNIDSFRDVPIILQTNSYWLSGHDQEEIPDDYFNNPQTMMEFQENGIKEHLEKIDDDYIPYLMPWFGVALIPGVFGSKIVFPKKLDPSCSEPCIKSIEDIDSLKTPDFEDNPFSKRVLDTIKYFKKKGKFPIAITDPQGTLDSISLMVGYKNLFYWMNDFPEKIEQLFKIVNDSLIEWVKIQKKYSGERKNQCNGAINVSLPEGLGVWWADDDSVILSPDLYKKFVVPNYSSLFGSFGGGMIHWCGDSIHQIDNILRVKEIKAVHNYMLENVDHSAKLQKRLKKERVCLVTGDVIPVEEELEDYLKKIKAKLDPRGLVLQFTISSKLGLKKGQYTTTNRNVIDSAQKILDFFRN